MRDRYGVNRRPRFVDGVRQASPLLGVVFGVGLLLLIGFFALVVLSWLVGSTLGPGPGFP